MEFKVFQLGMVVYIYNPTTTFGVEAGEFPQVWNQP